MSPPGEPQFVGREQELSRLESGLEDALGGKGRLFLLRGDAGIGKTRLTEELGGRAEARGAVFVRGRCWDGQGAPPFWPWVEVFRALLDRERRTRRTSADPAALSRAMSELRDRNAAATAPLVSLEGQQRFAVFESTVSALKRASADEPMVVVIEDLQAADRSSLLMLRFLAGELRNARLLVIGTKRDHERSEPGESAELIREIGRQGEILQIGPLSESESGKIVAAAFPAPVPRRVTAEIYRVTEGNPLYIHEVVRLLAGVSETTGSLPAVELPARLRDVIRRRIGSLPAEALEMLAVASVIGREFDAADAAACAGLTRERTVELLGEAVSLGLVNAVPERFQTYRFSHAVIRETLHEDLAPARRGELHARIADVLEQRQGGPEVVSRLAQHYLEVARAGGGGRKAVEYARRAADHALQSLAYQEASDQYELVLGLLEDEDASDEHVRCELLLALGEARSKAGEAAEARESFLAAADAARRLAPGSGEAANLLARAALGIGGIWLVTGIGVVDEPLRDLLEEALAALPEGDGAFRTRVLARLATELRWSDADDRRDTLSRSAVEMARRLGDASTLGYALIGRYWALWGPDNVEERRATAAEVVALGVAAADDAMALAGRTWRIAAALELGDVEAVDRDFEQVLRLAEKTRQPYYRWWSLSLEVMRALFCGRLDVAERLAAEALVIGREVQAQDTVPAYGVQMATLRREQGRLAEVEESLAAFIAEYPGIAAWRCALAYSYAEVGDAAAARSELERLAVEDFRDIFRDQQWLTAIALIGEVAAFLGDARRAGLCYELLLPYGDRNIVLGSATAFYGSVAHFLGVLAAFLSKPADAARHFETALAMNARMGARPFFARTQFEYARMLLAGDRTGDPEKARVLLEEARSTARDLGIRSLERKLAALSSPAAAEAVAEDLPAFRLEGDFWAIVHEGRVARVRDTRGMRYLEYLVRHPGRELHALDLASAVQGSGASSEAPPATRRRGARDIALETARLGDTGEVIDSRAKREYRERLGGLHAELEEATEHNDLGRAGRLREEIEALTRELAGAYGLGGRSRRSGSTAEKARVNITKTVQGAIERIGTQNAALAEHLRKKIRTGTFFCYLGTEPGPARTRRTR